MRIAVLLIGLSLAAGLGVGLVHEFPAAKQKRVDSAKVWFDKGRNEQKAGRHLEAITNYTKAINLNDEYASAYNNRGNAYSELKCHGLALSDYNQAIKIRPSFADAFNNRGTEWESLGNNERANRDYSKAIELDPRCTAFLENRAFLLTCSNPKSAIQDCKRALELNPKSARAYTSLGLANYYSKDYTRAITAYTEAIRLDPEDSISWSNRGAAHWMLGHEVAALSDLDKSIYLCSSRPYAFWLRGKIYRHQEKYEQAIHDLTWAIALDPTIADAYKERGYARARVKKCDYQGSLEDAQKAMELRSTDPDLITDTGVCILRFACKTRKIPHFKEALSYFDRAIGLDKNCGYAFLFRGMTRIELGDFKDAISDLNCCIRVGNYYGAYYFRGKAKLKLGDKHGARTDFLEAIRLNPSYEEATKALKSLQK